ncbi:alkaline phosphatase [Lewinella sp. JB7]|uniref:alkaline phosphatase n=1 Tax=Lewinella sp. JB7 TaxID=2962887 RepID=UPI0020CA13E2|nr:alkaline phosphatase [Lewinella sp. JB7]MCP9234551.1 alkaline phosphatase [Lewinella sp. JB7]
MNYSRVLFGLLAVLLYTACPPAPQNTTATTGQTRPGDTAIPSAAEALTRSTGGPKNIILMIGDGMGISQITAGLYSNGNRLNLERFPVVGLHKSYSGDNLITDSAAGATAFSAGVKTYNGAIGVDMDTMPVPTILEMAEAAGLPTGLVATSSIVHATPASFYAHANHRQNYEEIAADLMDTDIDLFIGGGAKFFERREMDTRNLSDELRKRGNDVRSFVDTEMKDLKVNRAKNFAYYTADGEPVPFSEGRDYLVAASKLAVNYLDERDKEDRGFFLMIEGSQIDWGGHANNSAYIISEMIEFDQAIGEVLNFAQRDGETLVIVTADHETGGYAINNGSVMGSIDGQFTSDYHTADLIPVFAFGPGAERFSGIYENTAIFDKMKLLYGFR